MTTAAAFQERVTKSVTNMDRLDGIINGDDETTVETDGGTVPSVAKLLADIVDEPPEGWLAAFANSPLKGATGDPGPAPQRADYTATAGQTRIPATGGLIDNEGDPFDPSARFVRLVVNGKDIHQDYFTYTRGADDPDDEAHIDLVAPNELELDGEITVYLAPVEAPYIGTTALRRMKKFDITDPRYGAVADSDGTLTSGTDNSTAFNNVLSDMRESGGGTLVIPPGELAFRIHQAETLIDFDRCEVICDGQVYFSNPDVGFWGRLRIDGRDTGSGRIERFVMEGRGAMFGRPGLHSNGMFVSDGSGGEVYQVGDYAPGLGPGYGGEDCLILLRGVDGFGVRGLRLYNSPNYVVGGISIAEGSFSQDLRISAGTAAIQCMDGTRSVAYDGVHAFDTSDDLLAFGYSGAPNRDCTIRNSIAKRCGARGLVNFSMGESSVINNTVEDTFLAGVLVEMSNYDGDRTTDHLQIMGNIIRRAGMYDDSPYVRGVDVGAGIRISSYYSNGRIKRATITGNQLFDSCNSHLTTDGVGTIDQLIVAGNIFDGIGRIVAPDDPVIGNGGAGGQSVAPPDGYYPGLKFNNAQELIVEGNQMRGAHEDGIYAFARVATIRGNLISQINGGYGGTPFPEVHAIISDGLATTATDNTLFGSPSTALLYDVRNPTVTPTGAIMPDTVVDVSDNFNRTNVSPVSGGLGATPVGAKTWVGSAVGIVSNQAYFGATPYGYQAYNAGVADVDVTMVVTVTAAGQRLYVRSSAGDPDQPCIIFDTTGDMYQWDGVGPVVVSAFPPLSVGVHTIRIVVKGDSALGYVDGGVIANLKGTSFPTGLFVGFQDNSAGLGRFDSFTSAPIPEAVVSGPVEAIVIPVGDETTAITTGTAKATYRAPFGFTLTEVRGVLATAQSTGSLFTVDVNVGGSSVLSTKLTLDNGEKTSTTAAAQPVLSATSVADDAEITIDVDQVGDGTAKGLKVTLYGYRN